MNQKKAIGYLRARIYQAERGNRGAALEELYGEKGDSAWGNQIRSYVLHPYQLVKDHRTKHETGNVEAVLDGKLTDFLEACLRESRGADDAS